MDIRIENEECSLKMRVSGCLIKDNKMLTVQMCHNGFYTLPGGHVHVGEDSISAIKREFEEEAKIKCTDAKMLALVENFFVNKYGKKFHEINYVYLLTADETVKTQDFSRVENDEGVLKDLEFKWFNLSDIKMVDFRPSIIKDKLASGNTNFEHIIFDQTK